VEEIAVRRGAAAVARGYEHLSVNQAMQGAPPGTHH